MAGTSGTAKEAVRKREEETKTVDGNGHHPGISTYRQDGTVSSEMVEKVGISRVT
jgi:hypothetical protein